ncbi:MAG: GAF domain-containing protein [Sphingobium sp.]
METSHGCLPVLPEAWQKLGAALGEGVDADYLLIDAGTASGDVRYMIVELRPRSYKLHFSQSLAEVHLGNFDHSLDIRSSLIIPLNVSREGHMGHIGLLFREERAFSDTDRQQLQLVADRLLNFLHNPLP